MPFGLASGGAFANSLITIIISNSSIDRNSFFTGGFGANLTVTNSNVVNSQMSGKIEITGSTIINSFIINGSNGGTFIYNSEISHCSGFTAGNPIGLSVANTANSNITIINSKVHNSFSLAGLDGAGNLLKTINFNNSDIDTCVFRPDFNLPNVNYGIIINDTKMKNCLNVEVMTDNGTSTGSPTATISASTITNMSFLRIGYLTFIGPVYQFNLVNSTLNNSYFNVQSLGTSNLSGITLSNSVLAAGNSFSTPTMDNGYLNNLSLINSTLTFGNNGIFGDSGVFVNNLSLVNTYLDLDVLAGQSIMLNNFSIDDNKVHIKVLTGFSATTLVVSTNMKIGTLPKGFSFKRITYGSNNTLVGGSGARLGLGIPATFNQYIGDNTISSINGTALFESGTTMQPITSDSDLKLKATVANITGGTISAVIEGILLTQPPQ